MLGGFEALGDFRSQSVGGTFRGRLSPRRRWALGGTAGEGDEAAATPQGPARLFPLPSPGHKYAVEIRGQLNGSAGPGHSESSPCCGTGLACQVAA